jgi:hypothetical protein
MYIAESRETPCQTSDPDLWFAKHDTKKAMIAKRACYSCAERIKCLDAAIKYERTLGEAQHGIYGGLAAYERQTFIDLPDVSELVSA